MTLAHLYYDKATHLNTDKKDAKDKYDVNSPTFEKLKMIATLCNNATFKPDNPEKDYYNSREIIQKRDTKGDASESAFLKFVEKIHNEESKQTTEEVRALYPAVHQIPFNSANKFQVSIHKLNNDTNNKILVMKRCT